MANILVRLEYRVLGHAQQILVDNQVMGKTLGTVSAFTFVAHMTDRIDPSRALKKLDHHVDLHEAICRR